MTEDTTLTKIEGLREVIQKNLAIVEQALGIEAISDDDWSELEIESEILAKDTIDNFRKRRLTALELAEEKRYLSAMRDIHRANFLESQAMFAESVVRFNGTKEDFVRQRKFRNR